MKYVKQRLVLDIANLPEDVQKEVYDYFHENVNDNESFIRLSWDWGDGLHIECPKLGALLVEEGFKIPNWFNERAEGDYSEPEGGWDKDIDIILLYRW